MMQRKLLKKKLIESLLKPRLLLRKPLPKLIASMMPSPKRSLSKVQSALRIASRMLRNKYSS
jgi:hypothetical protein